MKSATPAKRYGGKLNFAWNFGEKGFFSIAGFRPEMADSAKMKKNSKSRLFEVSEKYISLGGLGNIHELILMWQKVSDFSMT